MQTFCKKKLHKKKLGNLSEWVREKNDTTSPRTKIMQPLHTQIHASSQTKNIAGVAKSCPESGRLSRCQGVTKLENSNCEEKKLFVTQILWLKFCDSNFVTQILWLRFCDSDIVTQILWLRFCDSDFATQILWLKFCDSNFVTQNLWLKFCDSNFETQIFWLKFCDSNFVTRILWLKFCDSNLVTQVLLVLSQFEFLNFVTFKIFVFGLSFSFWVLSQFEILSFVTIWVFRFFFTVWVS